MLKLYATDEIRNRFTLIYRGYDLEVTRTPGRGEATVASCHGELTELSVLAHVAFDLVQL